MGIQDLTTNQQGPHVSPGASSHWPAPYSARGTTLFPDPWVRGAGQKLWGLWGPLFSPGPRAERWGRVILSKSGRERGEIQGGWGSGQPQGAFPIWGLRKSDSANPTLSPSSGNRRGRSRRRTRTARFWASQHHWNSEKTIHGRVAEGFPGWEAIAHLGGNHDAGVNQETHGVGKARACTFHSLWPQQARATSPFTKAAFARGTPRGPRLASPTPSSCAPVSQSAPLSSASRPGLRVGGADARLFGGEAPGAGSRTGSSGGVAQLWMSWLKGAGYN